MRCNPTKLLLDPYAKAIDGQVSWDEAVYGYSFGKPNDRNDLDSAPFVPKSLVIDPTFDWQGDYHPKISYSETVLYEAHVRGMTIAHPDVPSAVRGTFVGLIHETMLEYYRKLGITAIELMPVQQFIHANHLAENGLSNYWGYDSVGFFAPHSEYATSASAPGAQVNEFKEMVRRLHTEGIEVIIDVVFNHTGEGNQLGPTLSMRGLDNRVYYRLKHEEKREYANFTDTGNALNTAHPQVLRLVTDALRYWVTEMHVDGFRFDLAPVLIRDSDGNFTNANPFLATVQQDPVLNQVKLIAEPWDTGPDGYQVGAFPPPWREWNDRFRDGVRKFWAGWENTVGDFASRISGSADLYQRSGRCASSSINFVTCHDGFTLTDLVSYESKRNEANREGNSDGQDENYSRNWGADGPTKKEKVLARRARVKRALLATVAISRGVPMLLYGDELGRTQMGNNNAYCHDSKLSWVDWSMPGDNESLLRFTQEVLAFRRANPVIRQLQFAGRQQSSDAPADRANVLREMVWLSATGNEMREHAWSSSSLKYIALYLSGNSGDEQLRKQSYLMLFNASDGLLKVTMPNRSFGSHWAVVVDTYVPMVVDGSILRGGDTVGGPVISAGASHRIGANSLQILQCID